MRIFAINAGDEFKFTEAISLMVNCKTKLKLIIIWKNCHLTQNLNNVVGVRISMV